MRADEIIENNKKIASGSLKTTVEIERATLSVLTDISETLAMMTDLTASIYGREILNKKQLEQIRQQQMARQMPQVMQNVEQ
jgi:fumarylacetoacetate (FAA) hydrolase family protein